MKLALLLPPVPDRKWTLARQMGVRHAITKIPQKPAGEMPDMDFLSILHVKQRFEDAGLHLLALEGDQFPMQRIKLGLPGRDEDIERFCQLLRHMGATGIPMLCYNFMAQIGWLRTSVTTPGRGGALTSSFDYALLKQAPLTEAGIITEESLWENFIYFFERVMPVADEVKVRMALHPDDPPLSPIRGIGRIFRTLDAFQRVLDMYPSNYNGITFCQANFLAMGVDICKAIRHFGKQKKLFFAHFRDIEGTAERFVETFHDEGPTDMANVLRTYHDIEFEGPIRPDHTPTMAGEENANPGYEILGRLFAVGYLKGLLDAQNINYQ